MIHCILGTLLCAPNVAAPRAPQGEEAESSPRIEAANHADLQRELEAIANGSDLVSIESIGTSREGREIHVLRVATAEGDGRPGILVLGNIDGPDVFSSAVVAHHARELAARAADDETVQAALSAATLYFIARANPDAAEARFQSPLVERTRGGRGVDNDRDRRSGEDEPADVNGDGFVTQMRWLDPEGEWITDPNDERAMVRADATRGERGLYRMSVEGRDSDGDDEIAEDPAHDTVLNENFPYGWREHAPSAGRFPLDEPEAKALADFLLEHRDIVLVLTYGSLDNLVEKPKTVKENAPPQKRIPPPGVIEPDAELLARLGESYADVTGNKTKGSGEDAGSFQTWAYRHRGLWSLAVSLWEMPLEPEKSDEAEESEEDAGDDAQDESSDSAVEGASSEADEEPDREPSDDAKRLEWLDSVGLGERFVPWSAFDHPELGAVEIGGWKPFAHAEPPADATGEIAAKQLDFLLTLPATLARLEVTEFTAHALADGVWQLDAAIENGSLLPFQSVSARRTRQQRPARVRLVLPEGATLLAGEAQQLLRGLAGSGGRAEHRWLVQAGSTDGIRLEVDSDHAGVLEATPEVER